MPAFTYPPVPTTPGLTNYKVGYSPAIVGGPSGINLTPNGATTIQVSANIDMSECEYFSIQLGTMTTNGATTSLILSGSNEGMTYSRLTQIPVYVAAGGSVLPNGATVISSGTQNTLIPCGVVPTRWVQIALTAPTYLGTQTGSMTATAYIQADASITKTT